MATGLTTPARGARNRREGGFSIMELALALIGFGMFMVTVVYPTLDRSESLTTASTYARQLGELHAATREYVTANFVTLAGSTPAGSPVSTAVTVAALRSAGLLPTYFPPDSPYGPSWQIWVRRAGTSPDSLAFAVTTDGDVNLTNSQLGWVAIRSGVNAGPAGLVNLPAFSDWNTARAQFGFGATDNKVATIGVVGAGDVLSDFLYRVPAPPGSDGNRMATNIDMNGYDINGGGTFNANVMNATTAVNTAVLTASTSVSTPELHVGAEVIDEPDAKMINDLFGLACTDFQAVRLQGGVPVCIDTVVPDTIVGFNGNVCPPGWARFTAADGRMLIGTGSASGQSYSLGQTGGSAFHTLTQAEMPSHSHGYYDYWASDNNKGGQPAPDDNFFLKSLDSHNSYRTTNSAGGNQPHENRPPYVAVTWCIKTP